MRSFTRSFHAPWDISTRSSQCNYLFCFPFAGASPAAYYALFKALPRDIMPFVACQPEDPKAADLPSLARSWSEALVPIIAERPAVFWGHSMGALSAFEVCRALPLSIAPRLLIVSGHVAPHLPRQRRSVSLDKINDSEFIKMLKDYGGTPPAVLESTELLRLFLPRLRADLMLLQSYQYTPGPLLNCDILALNGDRDHLVRPEGALAWREHTTGAFRDLTVSGSHFFLHENRTEVVQKLSEAVRGATRLTQPAQTAIRGGARC